MTKGEKFKAKRIRQKLERAKRYSNMTGNDYHPNPRLVTIMRYVK